MVLMRRGGDTKCLPNVATNTITLTETHVSQDYGFNDDEKQFRKIFIGFCMSIILILMGGLTFTIVISFKQKKAKIDALVVKDQVQKLENAIF